MWSDDWIGLPYCEMGRGPDAYDCLGLFLALQRVRMGRALPDPRCTALEAVRRGAVDRARTQWERIMPDQAWEGDALLFLCAGRALHVGYALGPRLMLHTQSDTGASMIEGWRRAPWRDRLEGIYRHVG